MFQSSGKNIIDIRSYWQTFWRRKLLFIIALTLSLIMGIVISFFIKPVYESSVVVQINQTQSLSNAMRRLVPGVTGQERIESLRRLITSHDYLKQLILSSNLDQVHTMLTTTEFELREAKDRLDFLDSQIKNLGLNYPSPKNNVITIGRNKILIDQ